MARRHGRDNQWRQRTPEDVKRWYRREEAYRRRVTSSPARKRSHAAPSKKQLSRRNKQKGARR